jgi:hypothetical protein
MNRDLWSARRCTPIELVGDVSTYPRVDAIQRRRAAEAVAQAMHRLQ